MTKVDDDGQVQRSRCKQCRRVLPEQRRGRPREFCSQACRQWHWVGQQRARELQLNEDELVVTKATLDTLGEMVREVTPTRRLGNDEDLKGLVVLLASEASRHITGQYLAVDGGASCC